MDGIKQLLPLLLAVAVLAAIGAALKGKKGGAGKRFTAQKRAVLTKHEQPMFQRLAEAFPENVVLAQVGFGALMATKDKASFNRFAQKRADFVICSRAFEAVAVIELDDSSHKNSRASDEGRDALLESAGIRVLRYRSVPDVQTVRNDVTQAKNQR